MTQFVVYENPSDAPGRFVVRAWHIHANGTISAEPTAPSFATIEEARNFIPAGYTPIGRFAEDDPAIREAWI